MTGLGDIVKGALSGLRLGDALNTVLERTIPDPAKRAEVQLALQAEVNRHDEAVEAAADRAADQVTERAAELEGTASDLKSIPILGPIMLFLRGSQRVAWGFGVGYADIMVLSDTWRLPDIGWLPMAFFAINFLVLGFLFGERAVANILPLLTQFMQAKAVKQ
jgi:hypothetical protein